MELTPAAILILLVTGIGSFVLGRWLSRGRRAKRQVKELAAKRASETRQQRRARAPRLILTLARRRWMYRLPPQYRQPQYVVNDWRAHGLRPPPRGYYWVQNGSDYVLAAIATGVISAVIINALTNN